METHFEHPWAGSCQEPFALSGASAPQLKSAQGCLLSFWPLLLKVQVSCLRQCVPLLNHFFRLKLRGWTGVEVAHDSHV